MRSIFIIITSLCFLTGCATVYNPATGRNEFILIDSQTETAIGKNVIGEITKEHPVVDDRNLQERVGRIGRQVCAVSDRNDITYNFAVLADKDLNAVTLPGAYIFVNKGLMDALNDNELAYVIGHEVGHVAARHVVKKLQSGMAYQLLLTIALAGSKNSLGANADIVAKGAETIHNLIDLGYSRQDEYEADRLGAKYAFKAGFDPYSSLSALEKLKKGEGNNSKVLGYFRSHPYVDDRISALKKVIPGLVSNK